MSSTAERHTLEAALRHTFTRPELLTRALTHRSVSGTRAGKSGALRATETNERFEFLGDRVLGLAIAEALLNRFPSADEGELAQRLAALVAEPTLAAVARDLDLGVHVKAAPGQPTGAVDAILADACEAIVGAIYLDAGLDAARSFIACHWSARIEQAKAPPKDAKSALQEWAQGRGLPLPIYREIERSGPDHAPQFTVAVMVEGFADERGIGKSKQAAETVAATVFLDKQHHAR